MKEPKFRGWDRVEKRFLPWESLQECTVQDVFGKIFELQQSTGLHDLTGKEIYEGDILKSCTTGFLFPVTWWVEKAMFRAVKGNIFLDSAKSWKNSEIVGNIYEMPELLTK